MALSASELHRRGVAETNARRYAAARRTLAAASARTDDPDLLARIDGTRAYLLAQTGDHAEAERLCRDALSRAGLSPTTAALLNGQLGALLMHAGRADDAEPLLTRAIDALARAVDADGPEHSTELANCLMNRSMVRMQRHRLRASTEDLHRAIRIFEANRDEVPLAEARHNLGYAALLGGDLVTALTLMTASRPVLAASSEVAAAISDLDRAEVLRDAGLSTEAEALLAEVAVRFGATGMRQARGEAEYHLARSLIRHDPAAAARTAAAAARRFTRLGSQGWAARARAVELDARLRAETPPQPDEFTRAADDLARSGLRTEATAMRLAAASLSGERMPRIAASAPTPLRLRALELRAARAAAAGRRSEAMRLAAEGLDLLTTWQRSFGALDLQASVTMQARDLMFTGLAAAARTRDPAVLFEWSERARHQSQQVVPVRPRHDDELAADLAELRMLRADLAGTDWTANARVRVLRDRVRERQWSRTGGGAARERFGLAEASALLDARTAIAGYVFTGTELLCVVVAAHDAQVVELSWAQVRTALDGLRADLDMAALTRGGSMAAAVGHSLADRLSRLDDALVGPVRSAVPGTDRFVLTAPGVLAGVPWGMLPGLSGVPFTLATSASRWLSARHPSSARNAAGVAAEPDAGGPVGAGFSAVPHEADSTEHTRVGFTERLRVGLAERTRVGFAAGPRVPRAGEEIGVAASSWVDPVMLSDDRATVDAVTAIAGRSDVLHVAAHGRHAVDNPLFSGLELADGTLFGYDVDLIPTPPELVVLSACELGRSAVRWGEEALGMTRVWLHAGSECVVAAPVTVADDDACELLGAMHARLAQGQQPADALAAASVETGLRTPFQCHGNGF